MFGSNQCYANQLWLWRGRGQNEEDVNNPMSFINICLVSALPNSDDCVLEAESLSQWSVPVFTSVLLCLPG